jgi:hypothetical protein
MESEDGVKGRRDSIRLAPAAALITVVTPDGTGKLYSSEPNEGESGIRELWTAPTGESIKGVTRFDGELIVATDRRVIGLRACLRGAQDWYIETATGRRGCSECDAEGAIR